MLQSSDLESLVLASSISAFLSLCLTSIPCKFLSNAEVLHCILWKECRVLNPGRPRLIGLRLFKVLISQRYSGKPDRVNGEKKIFLVLGMTEAQHVMCSSDIECSNSGMIGTMTKEECCMRRHEGVAYSTPSNTGSWSDTKVCTVCIGESHQFSEHV